MTGKLYLIGTGPGDPELLTLKAARLLGTVAVLAYPQKPGQESLALSIAAPHVGADVVHLPADIPMSVARAPAQAAYDRLAAEIVAHLNAGRSVAYLCEGDPFFYGSAMYVADRVGRTHGVEVVPGVTSLTAAAAVSGRPLAARNEVLKVLPAPLPDEILARELASSDAAAIIKVGRHFDRVRTLLRAAGLAGSALVVEAATGPGQRVTRLEDFAGEDRPYFSTILCYRGTENWGGAND